MKPCKAHSANLDTIMRAAHDSRLALVEVRVKATGEIRAALCAIGDDGQGGYDIVPFALMIDDNPYETLDPPNPDGGFDETAPTP